MAKSEDKSDAGHQSEEQVGGDERPEWQRLQDSAIAELHHADRGRREGMSKRLIAAHMNEAGVLMRQASKAFLRKVK